MNTFYTSHAIFLSEDSTKFYGEKNKRFNDQITFFGGKLEKNETHEEGLLNELFEETGIDFSGKVVRILETQEGVCIKDNIFIGNLYLIYLTATEASSLLVANEGRNIVISTDQLDEIPFGFEGLKEKLLKALEYNNTND